jgi:hypothetical protein
MSGGDVFNFITHQNNQDMMSMTTELLNLRMLKIKMFRNKYIIYMLHQKINPSEEYIINTTLQQCLRDIYNNSTCLEIQHTIFNINNGENVKVVIFKNGRVIIAINNIPILSLLNYKNDTHILSSIGSCNYIDCNLHAMYFL